MFEDIYIIDCENELAMLLREKFVNEKMYRIKSIKPENIDVALKSIPDLIIINEQTIPHPNGSSKNGHCNSRNGDCCQNRRKNNRIYKRARCQGTDRNPC